jgi:hypothetical protein
VGVVIYVRKILLFVISLAMAAGGLLMLAFGLLGTRILTLSVAGGAILAFVGLYLLWEDFIAPLFIRDGPDSVPYTSRTASQEDVMDIEELVQVIYAELLRQAAEPRDDQEDDGGWGPDVFLGEDGVITFQGRIDRIDLIALATVIKAKQVSRSK